MIKMQPSSQARKLAGQLILPNWCARFGQDPERWPYTGYIFHYHDLMAGADSTRRLLTSVHQSYSQQHLSPPIFAVTEEGGTVHRFPSLPPPPSALLAGQLDPSDIRTIGRLTAIMLAMYGLGWNLAPVLDCYVPKNYVVGTRSFGNEEILSAAKSWIEGHKAIGIPVTIKHFPGHGHALKDSHKEAPIVNQHDKDWHQEMNSFVQFLSSSLVDAVMTAHIRFPEIDENPVTLSATWISDILRERLAFKGVIVTDALSMQAIRMLFEPGAAAVQALMAGVDLVDCGGDDNVAEDILESVARAIDSSRIPEPRIQASLKRINRLKESILPSGMWAYTLAARSFYDQFIPLINRGLEVRGNLSNFSLRSPRFWLTSSHQLEVEERVFAKDFAVKRLDMDKPQSWADLLAQKPEQLVVFTENMWKSPFAIHQLNRLCRVKQVLQVAVLDPLDALQVAGAYGTIFLRGNPFYADSVITSILGP